MIEAYKIANQNTTGRRQQDKAKKDMKSIWQPLEVGDRVLMRNLTSREGSGKLRSFCEQKVYIIEEVKDPDGLVYTVRESKINQTTKVEPFIEIISCHAVTCLIVTSIPQLRKTQHPQEKFLNIQW